LPCLSAMKVYLLSAAGFIALLVILCYYHRATVIPHLPQRLQALLPGSLTSEYMRVPSSFADQQAAGYSSVNFDLEANLDGDDSRTGLDEQGVAEIREIMRRERVNFDDARLLRHQRNMVRNNIDPVTGLPLDSKAVTRL